MPESLGMKMDVTTKKQAKNILRTKGYPIIVEPKTFSASFRKFIGSIQLTTSQKGKIASAFGKMSTLIAFSAKDESHYHWIGLYFDENQKLVIFITKGQEEIFKQLLGRKNLIMPSKPKEKLTGFRKDFSEELFRRESDGNISYAIFSRNMLERVAEACTK